MDCKAHRKTGEFELIHLHLECKNINLDDFIPCFTKMVGLFAVFNGCRSLRVSNVSPKSLMKVFRSAFGAIELNHKS